MTAAATGRRKSWLQRLRYRRLKVIQFRHNAGQTAALMAGIDHASGDVIVTIDADLQNDPRDIPLLLAKLDEGYDLVSAGASFGKTPRFVARLSAALPTGSYPACRVFGCMITVAL